MQNNRTAVIMLLAAACFWSTSGILIKMVSLHPLSIAGWRSLIAGITVLLLCRKSVCISWDRYTLGAAACMGLFCISFVGATKLGIAATAIVLQYSSAAWVAVLAPVMLGEPTRRRDWYIMALVSVGICLFFFDELSLQATAGLWCGVACSFLWAGTVLFLRKTREQSTAWPIALGNIMAAALCLPFMFSQVPTLQDAAGLVGLGTVSLGAGYAVYAYAVQRVTALEAVLICSVEPLINPIWVFLGTGEIPGPMSLTGGGLVLVAVTIRGILSTTDSRQMSVPATDC